MGVEEKKKSSFGTFRGVSYNAFEDRAMQLFSDMGNNRAGGQEKADKVRVKKQGGETVRELRIAMFFQIMMGARMRRVLRVRKELTLL